LKPEELFAALPPLETRRLVLRALTSSDDEAIFRIFSDTEVTRYYAWETFTHLGQAQKLLERTEELYRRQEAMRWGLTLKGEHAVIGTCGYTRWNRENKWGMIGYDLARRYWGQGLMSEAIREVIRFGFEEMDLHRIEATVIAGNKASMNVLSKAGFQEEGVMRERSYHQGRFQDVHLFALLRRQSSDA
jgi:ribosomal-protein-alanine N-acetyltransferase